VSTPLAIWLGVIGSIAAVGFGWRWASRRRSLPCPVWLRWLVELDNPFTATNRAATIVAALRIAPGMLVIDVGCGPGRVTLPIARAIRPDGEVVAIDVQRGMLDRARERARLEGITNIRFVECAVGRDELDVTDADRAVLVTVLGEIPDREAALRAIFAALKPGGILSITETLFDPHYQRRAEVERLARVVGFTEQAYFGNRLAYTLNLVRPEGVGA